MSDEFVAVELDQKALARVQKQLKGLDGKGIAEKLNKGTLATMRVLVPSVRGEAPVRTGLLRSKVRAAKARSGVGAILGSTDKKAHLVIRPHRIVTPGGRDTGRRTTGNPFVDRAVEPRLDKAMNEIQKALFEE